MYQAIRLSEHGMSILVCVLEINFKEKVIIDEMQFVEFMPGKGKTVGIFTAWKLQKKLPFFVDLDKAFNRMPREVVRLALGKLEVE